MKKILVTGTAGFIGFHLTQKLIREGDWDIIGLDSINNYYDVNLKYSRLHQTGIDKAKIEYNKFVNSDSSQRYKFVQLSLEDKENISTLFINEKFDYVVNLAAQAGVRYSLENPHSYITSNIVGFLNILEGCRWNKVKHLVYASSSSVYGANTKLPFSESDNIDHPISLYAATKKSNELMAHAYSALYGLPVSGLRFFTVYGPWGRPDMALFIFTKKILEGKSIDVYGNGEMKRDFTYIDDIVEGIYKVVVTVPSPNADWLNGQPDPSYSFAPYRVYNIGNNSPVELRYFIQSIERALNKKATKNFLPMQPGDVRSTYADIMKVSEIGFRPSTSIDAGIKKFTEWYLQYFSEKFREE